MRNTFILGLMAVALAGCMQTPTERAAIGALAGAAIADNQDESLIGGAALGGLVGVASCGVGLLPPCENRY
jgi:osmotically inducible lipoprotein OsmB